LGTHPNSFLSK